MTTEPQTSDPDTGQAGEQPAVVYRGSHDGPSGAGTVWLEQAGRPGAPIGVLTHRTGVDSHSPTGFSWGYAGSGPAELARAMLIDALGAEATCTTCRGARMVAIEYHPPTDKLVETPWRGDPATAPENVIRCQECDGTGTGVTRPMYQQFKFDVIAGLPEDGDFTLPRAEVRAWYRRHHDHGAAE